MRCEEGERKLDLTPIFEELLSSPSAYKPEGKLPDRDKPFERSR